MSVVCSESLTLCKNLSSSALAKTVERMERQQFFSNLRSKPKELKWLRMVIISVQGTLSFNWSLTITTRPSPTSLQTTLLANRMEACLKNRRLFRSASSWTSNPKRSPILNRSKRSLKPKPKPSQLLMSAGSPAMLKSRRRTSLPYIASSRMKMLMTLVSITMTTKNNLNIPQTTRKSGTPSKRALSSKTLSMSSSLPLSRRTKRTSKRTTTR